MAQVRSCTTEIELLKLNFANKCFLHMHYPPPPKWATSLSYTFIRKEIQYTVKTDEKDITQDING
jgi:hypothetical protein